MKILDQPTYKHVRSNHSLYPCKWLEKIMKSRVDELIKDNLIAAFVPRDAGVGAQLIPSSPLYGTSDDPGELGFKPISQ